MKRRLRTLALASLLAVVTILSAGCANVKMDLTFNEDGTVTQRGTYQVSQAFMDTDMRQKINSEMEKDRKRGFTVKEIEHGYTSEKTWDGVADIANLVIFAPNEKGQNLGVLVRKGLLYDYYGLDGYLPGSGNSAEDLKISGYDPYGLHDVANKTMQLAIDSMKADYTINTPYEMENVNAETVAPDKKSATWNLRPAIVDNKPVYIKAQFRMYHKSTIIIFSVIIGLLAIGTVVLAVLAYRKRNVPQQRTLLYGIAGGMLVVVLGLGGYMGYTLAKSPTLTAEDAVLTPKDNKWSDILDAKKKKPTAVKSDAGSQASSESSQDTAVDAAVKKTLDQHNLSGNITVSTYGHNPNGYLVVLDGPERRFIAVDTKNNRVARIIFLSGVGDLLNGMPGKATNQLNFTMEVLNDTYDSDQSLGRWNLANHLIPISADYTVQSAGTIEPGMLNSGVGVPPKNYKEVLQETKNVDMANLVLVELRELNRVGQMKQVKLPQ